MIITCKHGLCTSRLATVGRMWTRYDMGLLREIRMPRNEQSSRGQGQLPSSFLEVFFAMFLPLSLLERRCLDYKVPYLRGKNGLLTKFP